MKNKHVLWIDDQHMHIWESIFEELQRKNFEISTMKSLNNSAILALCMNKDIIVIHWGTFKGISKLGDLLVNIKSSFRDIKIVLIYQTRLFHLEHLIDGYLRVSSDFDEINKLLSSLD